MARIEFYRDKKRYIEDEVVLSFYNKIYEELRITVESTSIDGMSDGVKFDLEFLFADLLEGLGLLSYNNLSRIVGRGKAVKAWRRISNDGIEQGTEQA